MTRCPKHPDVILVWDTLDGRDFSHCFKCGRHARGECIECGRPHGGLTRQRQRCPTCAKIRKYAANNRRRARDCRNPECDAAVQPGSKLQYCRKRCCTRARTIAHQRKMDRNPTFRAKVLARKAAWRDRNGLKLLQYSRKGRLDGTWGYRSREAYLDAMKKQNAKPHRVLRHRQWSKDHQRVYSPHNRPKCKKCGRIIAWDGRGRPRERHPNCKRSAA